MTPDYAELLRRLLNLIRLGLIAEVDCAVQRVRVTVGGNTTGWRPWATWRAGDAQTWWPPTVGEQVILLSPEGDFDQSIAFPAVYSNHHPAPSDSAHHHTTRYADGAVIQYDSLSHTLEARLPSGGCASVKADCVTSDAPDTTCTGNLTVQKNLVVHGMTLLNAGMSVLASPGGAPATIQGELVVSEDIAINGIRFTAHQHGGIQSGGSDSGVAK